MILKKMMQYIVNAYPKMIQELSVDKIDDINLHITDIDYTRYDAMSNRGIGVCELYNSSNIIIL